MYNKKNKSENISFKKEHKVIITLVNKLEINKRYKKRALAWKNKQQNNEAMSDSPKLQFSYFSKFSIE